MYVMCRGRPSKKIKSDSMNDSISLNEINSSTSDIEVIILIIIVIYMYMCVL